MLKSARVVFNPTRDEMRFPGHGAGEIGDQ
jgi:hypothetical protein